MCTCRDIEKGKRYGKQNKEERQFKRLRMEIMATASKERTLMLMGK